jgi:D-glycero-alpha-D-manno-heptose-7-phosphate kinase
MRDAVLGSVYHHLLADVPSGRLNDLGALLHEAWMNKKKMATQFSNSHIEELYETARKHGALGGKLSVAGGGGYMFPYCNSNRRHNLAEQMERMGVQVVDFSFDFRGLQTWHAK